MGCLLKITTQTAPENIQWLHSMLFSCKRCNSWNMFLQLLLVLHKQIKQLNNTSKHDFAFLTKLDNINKLTYDGMEDDIDFVVSCHCEAAEKNKVFLSALLYIYFKNRT